MNKRTAAITAVGAYVPEFVLTNKILETMVDTNDEWITSRTGIKERRILKDSDKGTSFLAIKAAKNLIEKSNLDPAEIDLVITGNCYSRSSCSCYRSLCGYSNWRSQCLCL